VPLTLTGYYTGNNKVYNKASNATLTPTFTNTVSGDIVSLSGYIANFASVNVGNSIVINFSNVTVTNQNYSPIPSFGQIWKASTSSTLSSPASWQVAMSISGQYIILSANANTFRSTDYGNTWLPVTGNGGYYVAMSPNGQYGITANGYGRNIGIYYTSNYGATWTQNLTGTLAATSWHGVAMGPGGRALAFSKEENGEAKQGIIYSSDNGVTWNTTTGFPNSTDRGTTGVAMSSDTGIYAICCGQSTGLYYSSNYGQSWTQSNITSAQYGSLAISSTGQYCIASGVTNGYIYNSSNYGQTWTYNASLGYGSFGGVSMSATGQYCIIAGIAGSSNGIYYSSDYGITWKISNQTTYQFNKTVISSDGTYAFATSIYYGLFTQVNLNMSPITANITPATLIGNYYGINMVYNSNTLTPISYTLSGIFTNDQVSISSYIANFMSPYVGLNTVSISGITINNVNYTIANYGYTSANITPATLVPYFTVNKTYDSTQAASIFYSLSGIFNPDLGLVSLSSSLYGLYRNKIAISNQPVDISSIVLTGPLANNYQIANYLTTTGSIYSRLINIYGNNKYY
ncbi:MAG: exo-alpha-sialidase, partial [Flavobacteriia bacterium]|nr:exo-alpha-sialidase [Flavobacteriia bacterium]